MIGPRSRRVLLALLSGCLFASLPFALFEFDSESWAVTSLQWVGRCLTIPGGVIGFLVARGNVHVINLHVMYLANGIFYAGLSYWLLTIWANDRI
jgi:hypothetical protein